MSDQGIILIGAGGHAKACIDVIERQGAYQIAGLIGTAEEVGSKLLGHKIVGTDGDLAELASIHRFALIAVGQIGTPDIRAGLFARALSAGFELPAVISPNAYISRAAAIGKGSIVMHGSIVNANAEVGRNCIINSRALIEHDVKLGENCHVSTGAILNGKVRVGAGCFIGSGAVVRNGVTIGQRCFVGMGSIVTHGLADGAALKGAIHE